MLFNNLVNEALGLNDFKLNLSQKESKMRLKMLTEKFTQNKNDDQQLK